MFVGRKRELETLETLYKRAGFQMPVLYGRRRIGKTRLIREFVSGKPVIFYTATQDEAGICLRDFTSAIREYDDENVLLQAMDSFPTWDVAFDYILSLSQRTENGRLILVIDEYPYLARAYPAISSVLQRCIDTKWKESGLFLILSGSSMSFMEKKVLGYESPLYGRRTAQIRLRKMDYLEAVQFFPNWSREDALYAYDACDGVPQYLEIFARWKSFREAVENEFLTSSGGLIDEPELLLKEELREPAIYNSIIEGIAGGANKLGEIASAVGRMPNAISSYLANLVSLEIIEKISPVEDKSAKRTIYRLQDKLFHFWYRFIPKCRFQIAMGLQQAAYEAKIEPFLSEYFGSVFEEICLQYILRKTAEGSIPAAYDVYGKWWGTNPKEKRQEEIDIAATGSRDVLVGECKWQSEPVGYGVYNTLVERGDLIRKNRNIRYYLFSRNGFEQKLMDGGEPCLTLVGMDELFT